MRRGFATTEFWATVAVAVGSLAASVSDALPPRWAAVAVSVSVGAYSIARGLAKLGPVGTVSVPPAPAAAAPPPVVAPPLGS